MEESEGHWETLVCDEDYEIYSDYPYQIRKKINKRIIKETLDNREKYGYIMCFLNLVRYPKHRIIAKQFLPNPNNLPEVDHINHNRSDNRIDNLRWISASNNSRNKSSHLGVLYTFVDDISPEAIHVTEYSGHEFSDLYFHENVFYYWNGIQYRKLHITEKRNGALSVCIRDDNHSRVTICYSKFKREYDLI
jgi:hypothetical protein